MKKSSDEHEMSENEKYQPKSKTTKTGGLTGGLWEVLREVLREVSHGLPILKYLIIIALVKTTGGLDKNDNIHECEERKVR